MEYSTVSNRVKSKPTDNFYYRSTVSQNVKEKLKKKLLATCINSDNVSQICACEYNVNQTQSSRPLFSKNYQPSKLKAALEQTDDNNPSYVPLIKIIDLQSETSSQKSDVQFYIKKSNISCEASNKLRKFVDKERLLQVNVVTHTVDLCNDISIDSTNSKVPTPKTINPATNGTDSTCGLQESINYNLSNDFDERGVYSLSGSSREPLKVLNKQIKACDWLFNPANRNQANINISNTNQRLEIKGNEHQNLKIKTIYKWLNYDEIKNGKTLKSGRPRGVFKLPQVVLERIDEKYELINSHVNISLLKLKKQLDVHDNKILDKQVNQSSVPNVQNFMIVKAVSKTPEIFMKQEVPMMVELPEEMKELPNTIHVQSKHDTVKPIDFQGLNRAQMRLEQVMPTDVNTVLIKEKQMELMCSSPLLRKMLQRKKPKHIKRFQVTEQRNNNSYDFLDSNKIQVKCPLKYQEKNCIHLKTHEARTSHCFGHTCNKCWLWFSTKQQYYLHTLHHHDPPSKHKVKISSLKHKKRLDVHDNEIMDKQVNQSSVPSVQNLMMVKAVSKTPEIFMKQEVPVMVEPPEEMPVLPNAIHVQSKHDTVKPTDFQGLNRTQMRLEQVMPTDVNTVLIKEKQMELVCSSPHVRKMQQRKKPKHIKRFQVTEQRNNNSYDFLDSNKIQVKCPLKYQEKNCIHLKTHEARTSHCFGHTCNKCWLWFSTKQQYYLHHLHHHDPSSKHKVKKGLQLVKFHECRVCGRKYRFQCRLKRHCRVHTGNLS